MHVQHVNDMTVKCSTVATAVKENLYTICNSVNSFSDKQTEG